MKAELTKDAAGKGHHKVRVLRESPTQTLEERLAAAEAQLADLTKRLTALEKPKK